MVKTIRKGRRTDSSMSKHGAKDPLLHGQKSSPVYRKQSFGVSEGSLVERGESTRHRMGTLKRWKQAFYIPGTYCGAIQ